MTRHVVPFRVVACVCAATMLVPPWGLPTGVAQAQPVDAAAAQAPAYSPEQLDALLAPIALYPDALLTQVLMASAWPLQVVEAARWVSAPGNAALQGDALAQALQTQPWDPAVKSLVPFPTVLALMNSQLDWLQQLGYAVATQQGDVLDSVQRLRRQAQGTGCLKTTEQQVVSMQGQTIVIAPASPQVVYVPAYNPTVVYGAWPYPAYPPVYLPPPPGYAVGNALLTGIAFGVGVGIVASLWNVGSPNWGYRNVNVNVNRWNTINVNRPPISNPGWRPPPPAGGGGWRPPAGGPVGPPRPGGGLPPNAIGRSSVAVPGNLVQRPPAGRPGGPGGPQGQRPGGPGGINGPGNAGQRPGGGPPPGVQRPAGGPPSGVQRPGGGQAARPAQPGGGARPSAPAARPPAFNTQQGNRAPQYGQRGQQSRQMSRPAPQAQAPRAQPRAQAAPPGGGGGGGGRGGDRRR